MFPLPQKWLILIVLNAVYFFVYFHRVSPAVLAPYLIEAFSASATNLGLMSSAYFYPYALCQPLVGYLTDRWGSRKVITLSVGISGLGALLFGLAPTLWVATIGRGLIGLGSGGIFVPAIRALIPWFGPSTISHMNALLLAVGNIAAIVAATPFAWIILQAGWRLSFWVVSVIMGLLLFLSWAIIRDTPPHFPTPAEEGAPKALSIRENFVGVLKMPFFWLMSLMFFFYGGPFSTFQGLWGYPFLIDIFQMDKLEAANLMIVIALGVILGGPVLVFWTEKAFPTRRRQVLSVIIAAQLLNWSLIVFGGPSLNIQSLYLVLFVMGVGLSATLSLVWSIVREATSPEQLGTMMGLINPFPFLGIALFQPATGYLMDRVGKVENAFPFAAYQRAFGLCWLAILAAFILSIILMKGKRT